MTVMSRLIVVAGGQYGSEAKGAVTARLATESSAPLVIRVGGPNAGHTVIDPKGREWKLRHVPVGFVNPRAMLLLAAGSEVDAEVLFAEINALEDAGYDVGRRLYVDPQATLLENRHIRMEAESTLTSRLGSTAKGVGAARADRIWRTAELCGNLHNPIHTAGTVHDWFGTGHDVIVEGTQGYGLGLRAGHYPFCTSGDVRAIDLLAQAGISPWNWFRRNVEIWLVFRTRPIRVAGNSGPIHGETSWHELGLPEERTTVTNRVRRVGEWDPNLAYDALMANGGPSISMRIAITMLDQLFPEVAGVTEWEQLSDRAVDWLQGREKELGQPISMVGTGPGTQTMGEFNAI